MFVWWILHLHQLKSPYLYYYITNLLEYKGFLHLFIHLLIYLFIYLFINFFLSKKQLKGLFYLFIFVIFITDLQGH